MIVNLGRCRGYGDITAEYRRDLQEQRKFMDEPAQNWKTQSGPPLNGAPLSNFLDEWKVARDQPSRLQAALEPSPEKDALLANLVSREGPINEAIEKANDLYYRMHGGFFGSVKWAGDLMSPCIQAIERAYALTWYYNDAALRGEQAANIAVNRRKDAEASDEHTEQLQKEADEHIAQAQTNLEKAAAATSQVKADVAATEAIKVRAQSVLSQKAFTKALAKAEGEDTILGLPTAGFIAAVVGGVALLGGGAYFLLRKRGSGKKSKR